MRARWAVVVGVVLGVLGMSFLASPAVATAPVTLGSGYVTDEVGALSSAEVTALDARLTTLSRTKDMQLFVVFIDAFTDPENSQQWTEQVARDNGLGRNQYLLAIAVSDRQFYISADSRGPVSLSRVDAISDSLVNDLHDQHWAAAVRTAAAGFEGAGSSGGWGVGGIVLGGVAVVAIVAGVWVLFAMRRRAAARIAPVTTEQVTDPLDAISDEELAQRAGSALVHTDDAVTSSTEDLGFAIAQFGDSATSVFADVVSKARAKLDEAFALRQKLDDDVPDTPQQRREWDLRIIQLCEEADAALDANVAAFDELRRLEEGAEQALQQLEAHRADAAAAVDAAPAALERLVAVYDASALRTVADNPAQARSRLELADARIADAQRLLAEDKRGETAFAIRTAEEAVLQAGQLAAAISTLHDDLGRTEDQARALMSDLEQDIAGASALPASPELDAVVAGTREALDQARTDLTGTGRRPQAVVEALTAANTRIDGAVSAIRSGQQQAERAQQVLQQTLAQARAEITTANTYITTRRGAIGADPRTRVAQASTEYDQAETTRLADPGTALQHAQRAIALAREASSLASGSVDGYGVDQSVPNAGAWGGGNLGDAILGGIIGGILSGAGHSSGWGAGRNGGGWRSSGGGFGASSFGGGGFGGGGGRSGSGGRF
ncbi:TPM domain-containing protein [Microbacterium sp. ASV81]|uniref:TPM domain-containing protein n=1 Tax=Microbacterium capsulatum TaxID=3041921 RepID=A0ABU0XB34_9MICO|nr:TPM domain-containing protein [Microbacterium sp. ASV81]MDQ4212322.1 TPM domain-containing protein [Microbacterium sp. ASV81]